MKFDELNEYKKDFKKLAKRYKTLKSDIDVVKKVLAIRPDEHPPFSYRISNLGINDCIIKIKKIACRSLKGRGVNTGLRLVYAYLKNDDSSNEKIIFIEIYHKGDKANEDRDRILKYFK